MSNLESTGNNSESRNKIRQWLNRSMKIKITDGRYVIGTFLCTDKHSNIILGSCQEFIDSTG
jgi:small nuclear ribonucleoprotein (snRNP)-like protein